MNISTVLAIDMATSSIWTALNRTCVQSCVFDYNILAGHIKQMLFEFYYFCELSCI